MMGGRDERKGLKLYVKRVFIMDAAEQLAAVLPALSSRGVVDSDDLPLNVSREILQQNRNLEKLRRPARSRVLDLLDKLAKDDRRSSRRSGTSSARSSRRAWPRISPTRNA
jgi:molecular chaperone HtpG